MLTIDFIQKLWQRLTRWLRRWFDRKPPRGQSFRPNGGSDRKTTPFEDADYEMLFFQILEGVHRGWTEPDVMKYIAETGDRAPLSEWIAWLRRFGDRLSDRTASQEELARRLLKLGKLGCGELGAIASEIAAQLLAGAPADARLAQKTQATREVRASQEKENNWIELGNRCLAEGKYEEALSYYQKEILLHPDSEAAWNNQFVAQYALQRYEDALKTLDTFLQLYPDLHHGWFHRGSIYAILNRYEEAIACYEQSLALYAILAARVSIPPDWALARANLGTALLALGRYAEAIANFDKVLQLEKDNALAWEQRGIALKHLGRPEEALASLNAALSLEPEAFLAQCNHSHCLEILGRYEEALASIDLALERVPEHHGLQEVRRKIVECMNSDSVAL